MEFHWRVTNLVILCCIEKLKKKNCLGPSKQCCKHCIFTDRTRFADGQSYFGKFPDDDGRCHDPAFSQSNRKLVLQCLEEIRDLCDTYQCSFTQLAIAWCLHQKGIISAIVGARTPEQVLENAKSIQLDINKDDIHRITKSFLSVAQL